MQSSTISQNSGAQNDLMPMSLDQNAKNDYLINPQFRSETNKLRQAGRTLYQEMISGQEPLERLSKTQSQINPNAATAEDFIQQVRNSGGTVDYTLTNMVDRYGNPIDASWKEIVNMPDDELFQLNEYMQNKHNIARQAQGKPVLDKTTSESAAKAAEMEAINPNLNVKAQEIKNYWDKFIREWAVKGGIAQKPRGVVN